MWTLTATHRTPAVCVFSVLCRQMHFVAAEYARSGVDHCSTAARSACMHGQGGYAAAGRYSGDVTSVVYTKSLSKGTYAVSVWGIGRLCYTFLAAYGFYQAKHVQRLRQLLYKVNDFFERLRKVRSLCKLL